MSGSISTFEGGKGGKEAGREQRQNNSPLKFEPSPPSSSVGRALPSIQLKVTATIYLQQLFFICILYTVP